MFESTLSKVQISPNRKKLEAKKSVISSFPFLWCPVLISAIDQNLLNIQKHVILVWYL